IVRGGASDLYGSGAMSGVVQFIRRSDDAIAAGISYGQQSTADGQLYAAAKRDDWRASAAADLFTTDGYVLVQPSQRGPVDTPADSRHTSIDLTVARGGLFARASDYDESRHNGTPLQTNDTTIRQLTLGADLSALSLRAYASDQDYHQTFSAVAANRQSERLTVEQHVPSSAAGASAQWLALARGADGAVAAAQRAHSQLSRRQCAHVGQRPTRPGAAVRGGSGRAQRTASADAVLDDDDRHDRQRHALDHAGADHAPAPELRQQPLARRGAR